ncbi:MAG TPA: NAD(P)-dependent alcohol dehydrogenase [Povalibacter sp.]|nr:NAD(P)-dependent alcohol dehydrogenase [Povalibacter sp.]
MSRVRQISGIVVIVLAVALTTFALVLRHESACTAAPPLPANAKPMKAIVQRCYGPPQALAYEDIEKPTVADDEVLIRVRAASVNPLDWHVVRGIPYIMRMGAGFGAPDISRVGVDFAGTVEAVGRNVTKFKPGDEVFGGKRGAFAEYVSVREDRPMVLKPANATFEQAAAVPIAAITALQALRDQGHVQPGQKVLINGASGGVGTFAVQIAKSMGAEVTGVCSTRNVDMVRSLGADHVIDYTREDFTRGAEHYDVIVDNVGSHALRDYVHVLNPAGTFVIVGGPSEGRWIGAMSGPLKAYVLSPFVSQKLVFFIADMNPADLAILSELMRSGKVTPVIDRTYKLSEVAAAIEYVEKGHARGKVIVDVE